MVPSYLKIAMLAAVMALVSANCPPYWTAYRDSCFQLFNRPMTFLEAETFCMSFSTCEGNEVGHLASILDGGANNFLVRYKELLEVPGGQPAIIWVGLNDLATEGTYEWTNGANATYTNWENGQPNNDLGQENCITLPGLNSVDQWNDANCMDVLPFICELPGVDPRAQQMECPAPF